MGPGLVVAFSAVMLTFTLTGAASVNSGIRGHHDAAPPLAKAVRFRSHHGFVRYRRSRAYGYRPYFYRPRFSPL